MSGASSEGDGGQKLECRIEGELTVLPAAVEVAAFYIRSRGDHEAVRHASAGRCTVRVTDDDGSLTSEVTDDGRGLPATATPGVGLHSMLERATELGGSCRLEAPSEGGTRLTARLPTGERKSSAPD